MTALAGLTRDAAQYERDIIQHSFGVTMGLADRVQSFEGDGTRCDTALANFVAGQERLITIGVLDAAGYMWCASNGQRMDFGGDPLWPQRVANPVPMVNVVANGRVSKRPVVTILQPLFDEGAFAGYIFASIPHEDVYLPPEALEENDLSFITFTAEGQVMSVGGSGVNEVAALLPEGQELAELVGNGTVVFSADVPSGAHRIFAVSPIVHDTVYVLGSWNPEPRGMTFLPATISAQLFPIIMWITSLGVAFAAVHRLVIRHIKRLQKTMRNFASSRRLPSANTDPELVSEIEEILETFRITAQTVLAEEAELEQLVHDKNVLLKEVHHRVKNNLQLISSIMNMQLRQMKSSEAKAVVLRLQERVLGLATIHRNLYRTENLSKVQARDLLSDIVNQLLAMAEGPAARVRVERDFVDVPLYPDQAVPLSLLVAEAVTNALKYMDQTDDDAWIRLNLAQLDNQDLEICICNSRGESAGEVSSKGTGLGMSLMRAFAVQLGGDLVIEDGAEIYAVRVRFKPQAFIPGD
ncbi:MAG: sensor histidine kinase [Mangrovicoccus sp.]